MQKKLTFDFSDLEKTLDSIFERIKKNEEKPAEAPENNIYDELFYFIDPLHNDSPTNPVSGSFAYNTSVTVNPDYAGEWESTLVLDSEQKERNEKSGYKVMLDGDESPKYQIHEEDKAKLSNRYKADEWKYKIQSTCQLFSGAKSIELKSLRLKQINSDTCQIEAEVEIFPLLPTDDGFSNGNFIRFGGRGIQSILKSGFEAVKISLFRNNIEWDSLKFEGTVKNIRISNNPDGTVSYTADICGLKSLDKNWL